MKLKRVSVEFGDRLRYLREQRSMTQTELGRKLCVTQQTVASWESGRTEPNIQLMKMMADIFGVAIQTFFYKQDDDCGSDTMNTEFYVIQKNARRMTEAEMAKMFDLLRLSFEGYDWDIRRKQVKKIGAMV